MDYFILLVKIIEKIQSFKETIRDCLQETVGQADNK